MTAPDLEKIILARLAPCSEKEIVRQPPILWSSKRVTPEDYCLVKRDA